MSPFDAAVVALLVLLVGLSGFVAAALRRVYVQQYDSFRASEAHEAAREARRKQRRAERMARAEQHAARAVQERAVRELTRRREQPAREQRRKAYRAAREARATAVLDRLRGVEVALVRMLTHLRHMDPEIREASAAVPMLPEAPDSEPELGPERPEGRGPSVAILPPAPAPVEGRKLTPTQPSMPSPAVRESKPAVRVVDKSEDERSSGGELT